MEGGQKPCSTTLLAASWAAQPAGPLIFDTAGNLYGTTYSGGFYTCGNSGCGTVFSLRRSTGGWNLRVLHSFDGSDGDGPNAALTFDSTGSLYGTTSAGGQKGYGVVFKLSHSGSRWTETRLHSFRREGREQILAEG